MLALVKQKKGEGLVDLEVGEAMKILLMPEKNKKVTRLLLSI